MRDGMDAQDCLFLMFIFFAALYCTIYALFDRGNK